MYTESEDAYRFASFMVPHKLYLLYLLVMLYDETGQNAEAYILALQILDKDTMMKSEAMEEIRAAINGIIKESEIRTIE